MFFEVSIVKKKVLIEIEREALQLVESTHPQTANSEQYQTGIKHKTKFLNCEKPPILSCIVFGHIW